MRSLYVKSFTLIELLIVIVIIGILASALIPRLTGMQDKAKRSRVESDMRNFRVVLYQAQNNVNKNLNEITWRTCGVHCVCRYPNVKLSTLPKSDICISNRIDSLRKLEIANDMISGALAYMEKDPWWSPYLLYELPQWHIYACEFEDRIEVVGPDQIYTEDMSGNPSPLWNTDNKRFGFPHRDCPWAY